MDCDTNITETCEQNNAITSLLKTISPHHNKFHQEDFNPADDQELMDAIGDGEINIGIYFPDKVRVYQFKNRKVVVNEYGRRTHPANTRSTGKLSGAGQS